MKNKISLLIENLNKIHSSLEVKNNLKKTKELITFNESEVIKLIKEYFESDYEILEDVFEHEYYKFNKCVFDDYSFLSEKKTEKEIEEKEINGLKLRISKVVDYLSLIEYYNKYDGLIINSINEKRDFILKKLNFVFNDNYYSLSKILDLNGIENRQGETKEIAEDLAKRGYVILFSQYGNNGDYVKISVKGASYIERKTPVKSKKKSQEELDVKIEKITEMLIKLGYGQEIIFNEMEEIRNLYSKLNKKNWSELVKGKLIDLGLSQVLNKETISTIFETLIEQKFRLLN